MKASMPAYPIDLCDARKEAVACQANELIREAKTVQQEFVHSNILTSNSAMLRIVRIAQQVANTDVPVLMLGESGVGKDVFAHFIHNKSMSAAVKEWAILADQEGPSRRESMAMRMSPAPQS